LAQFRAWFEEFEAARFDEEVERDAAAGKLDSLADEAVREFRKRSRSPALTAQAAGSAA
jgi:hypothetical protein